MADMTGRVHSLQSLGTVDGPGVRFVVFLQGCPLRCGCCHNPDTWDFDGGETYTVEDLMQRIRRCRAYFGEKGGVTVSGGEPLMQSAFVTELFSACRRENINTCLDTSGAVMNESVRRLLTFTDRVLLDVKYPTEEGYRAHVGCSQQAPLALLQAADELRIPVTLRQVTIPTLTDNAESVEFLLSLREKYACVDGIELLPFRKICQVKYDQMGLPFPFGHLPEPDRETMERLNGLVNQ